ncbi:HAMP domain-containing sensor histidine kinase, partial [Georgenia sp. 10Sc9-8]|nr:HAMP domain-containing sensor histidine kinase [Georgenia halotolerans]
MLARWRAAPLRARLVVLTTVLLLAGLSMAGAATATVLRAYLLDQVDTELTGSAQALGQRSLDQLRAGHGEEVLLPSDYYARIQDSSGTVVELVSPRTEETLGRPAVGNVDLTELSGMTDPVTVPGRGEAERWRAVTLPVTAPGTPTIGAVTVALPLATADLTMQRIGRALILSAVVVLVAGGVAAWYLVRRELRPLREVEATAGAIAAGDLTRRVPDGEPTTELGSLARSLNSMLAQIEQSFAARAASEQRMRRFVSDASHELRTPLATVRGYGELYRMGAVPDDAVPDTMRRIESEAKRMGTLVEDLLQLARLDEGRPLELAEVDLRTVAVDAVTDLRALAPDRPAAVVAL